MANAREVALRTLIACQRQGAWSDGHLKKAIREGGLDKRDAALCTRLCFGVLQNQLLLDWYLAQFSHTRLEKLEGAVLCNLRLALYQLCFMDKIPASAAVNEAVELTRKYTRNPRAAGMVNGILRNFIRQRENLSEPQGADQQETMSIRYSHPRWLVEAFEKRLGQAGAEALLAADNGQPPTMAQVNTEKTSALQLKRELEEKGVQATEHPWLPNCLTLSGTGDLEQLDAYQNGWFYIQDGGAKLSVLAADPKPGQRVLDCCAAPGGKSFAAAIAMENKGEVQSCDIHPHKIKLIEAGGKRLGLDIVHACLQNGTQFREEWSQGFDVVITDVPCSGLGIIRKKPDIRYKEPELLTGLPKVQGAILENCARYVRPGGTLLYSTCTLLQQENEDVVEAFLSCHPEFTLADYTLPEIGQVDGILTLWPHIHGTDGFFMAKLKREG
jgi:16S rRNA (cytosine967-C5)-methyltransferase